MKPVLAAFAFALGTITPALAQISVPTTVQGPNASPVDVSKVYAQVNGVFWMTCLNFTNKTDKTIRAIQFQLTYVDAFDTPMTTYRADRVGEFAPGVLIEGPDNALDVGTTGSQRKAENCWKVAQVVGSLSKITAEVQKVRYADGTIWTAPANHPIFSGTYMMDDAGGDHPDKLKCQTGMISLVFSWDELQRKIRSGGRQAEIARNCIERWQREHPPAAPAPSPTP